MTLKRFIPAVFLLSLLLWPLPSNGEQRVVIRYLFSMDGATSGEPFAGIHDIFVDNARNEVYVLDNGSRRVLILEPDGTFIYQFGFMEAGITSQPIEIAAADDGRIYVAEEKRVAVISYRGVYLHDLDLSTVPDGEKKMIIQSIAMDGDVLYLGDSANMRVVVMDRKTETFVRQFEEGLSRNIHLALDTDGIYVRDPAIFSVLRMDREGKPMGRFGKVSGLAGGFSMVSDMAVDRKNGRVILADTNRAAVIFFDREGNYLFEFGGAGVFKWPRTVATDNEGRIYVSDAMQKIRVFTAVPVVEEVKPETQVEGTSAGAGGTQIEGTSPPAGPASVPAATGGTQVEGTSQPAGPVGNGADEGKK